MRRAPTSTESPGRAESLSSSSSTVGAAAPQALQGHTVLEAINRQLAHYPYHIGQIVFIGKMLTKDKWVSLSIPKGASTDVNREMFSRPKGEQPFTDETTKKKT